MYFSVYANKLTFFSLGQLQDTNTQTHTYVLISGVVICGSKIITKHIDFHQE